MTELPVALQNLVTELARLPGVGSRTAERYAYHLLKANETRSIDLANTLSHLHTDIKYCPKTFMLMDASDELSPLYTSSKHNKQIVAVVEDPFDVIALENTRQFHGTYHVLGGAISPIDGIGPDQLHIQELLQRIEDDSVQEIIIATNASVEGESTAIYTTKLIRQASPEIKITRLAKGLPVGTDLEYADQITLKYALEGRTAI